jgi:hypothetical protein
MTDRKRLVELLRKSEILCDDCGQHGNSYCTEAIADYLLTNGVIVPPCKVGDKVYCIVEYHSKGFQRLPAKEVIVEEEVTRIAKLKMPYFFFDTNTVHFTEEKIGKTVFLTPEEAEQALAEREKQ